MSPEDHMSLASCLFTWGVLLGGVIALALALYREQVREWWDAFRQDIRDAR